MNLTADRAPSFAKKLIASSPVFKDFKINTRDISIFLDTECISIIDKVYAKDFELFNYKNENKLI